MVCHQTLTVRHTFWEIVEMSLKEKSLECRRGRAMTDGMCEDPKNCPPAADDVVTVAPSSNCSDSWADEVDDVDSDTISVSSFPALPPGVFTTPQSPKDKRSKKVGLWSPGEVVCCTESRTTLVIKNVHTHSKRDDLCNLLDIHGFMGHYDFIYVPANFKTLSSFGYAFVNFVNGESAQSAMEYFNDFCWTFEDAESMLKVSWSDPHQGLDVHVDRYRNCPVMHRSVSDEYKPILLSNGVRIVFPAPTKALSAPRDVRRRQMGACK
jgi:hypothetical protein